MYYKRRTIHEQQTTAKTNQYNENGKLKKGYRYSGNGEIKDSSGNVFLISDYK